MQSIRAVFICIVTLTLAACGGGGGTPPVSLLSKAVTPASPRVAKGLTQQFTATGTYTDKSTSDLTSKVGWFSSSTTTSPVDAITGLAHALAPGTTPITATLGQVPVTASLNVTAAALQSMAIAPNPAFSGVGISGQLTATGTYTDGTTADVTTMAVWASSAPSVVTVGSSTGQQTGVAVGSTTGSATIGTINAATSLSVVTNTWVAGNSLIHPRFRHSATVLTNGNVLLAGGAAASELYSPLAGSWSATGSLSRLGGGGNTATLLANGQVLAAGGNDSKGYSNGAEVYDPVAGTWTPTGSMTAVRFNHTATLLPNGKVLVVGFGSAGFKASSITELYDPSVGTWSVTGSMSTPRFSHTATLLPNGKVLVAGGTINELGGPTDTAELYDPTTGVWSPTGSLAATRTNHTATLLPNGTVLVAGGATFTGTSGGSALVAVVDSAEVYDPASGTWSPTGRMSAPRWLHTAAVLPSGKVLLAAGQSFTLPYGVYGDALYETLATTDLYHPASGTWTAAASLAHARYWHTQTVLPGGVVMVTGGFADQDPNQSVANSVELYYP